MGKGKKGRQGGKEEREEKEERGKRRKERKRGKKSFSISSYVSSDSMLSMETENLGSSSTLYFNYTGPRTTHRLLALDFSSVK